MYNSAAARIATAAAPIAIPAMAPPERPELCDAATAALDVAAAAVWVGEEELDVEVGVEAAAPLLKGSGVLSNGQGSPGWSMKVEFSANSFCRAREVEAFGLMTPTMP